MAYLTFHKWLVSVCNIHTDIMNGTNQNQSLGKSELCYYFIRLTIFNKENHLSGKWAKNIFDSKLFKQFHRNRYACPSCRKIGSHPGHVIMSHGKSWKVDETTHNINTDQQSCSAITLKAHIHKQNNFRYKKWLKFFIFKTFFTPG